MMYSLLTEFRDGDNVVTTLMEHNSNFVPWHALCQEILPRLGRRVECRLARFDHDTGELDLDHLAELVDHAPSWSACTGASNFLGTKPPLAASGRSRPQRVPPADGRAPVAAAWSTEPSWCPSTNVDVARRSTSTTSPSPSTSARALRRRGPLRQRESARERSLPFLYGGDMIAEGQVSPGHVAYNELPWKYVAGTPNMLGVIASAQALRLLVDLALDPAEPWFDNPRPLPRPVVARPWTWSTDTSST